MPAKKAITSEKIYQLKITLVGAKPPIWRRVQVPADISLGGLHSVIQAAMGWYDCHLHLFHAHGEMYGVPSKEDDLDWDIDMKDEDRAKLNKIVPGEKSKFRYEYDFGDSWMHDILVEKILPAEPDTRYPICLTGKRACPLEDSGGIWGYMSLLETLADPNSEEHEEMSEWVDGELDPEAFDIATVNIRLESY